MADATSCAIHYVWDGYSMDRKEVKGRHSAGLGFLNGIARHLPGDPLACYAGTQRDAQAFADHVATAAGQPRSVRWVAAGNHPALASIGALFVPGPSLEGYAWERRRFAALAGSRLGGQRAYSLCGVTHTICSEAVLTGLGALATAPVQPWDAVVCTSRPAKVAIEALLDRWTDYLSSRFAVPALPRLGPQLPVIPLGVDCDRFAATPANQARRDAFRGQHGIAAGDVAVLFFGRLTFHAKAHPVAMFLACEIASRRCAGRLHLLLAGRFPNDAVRGQFLAAAARYAPSVRLLLVDGAEDEQALASWFGSDIFLSLSDNIQETFGLTPIEAMAAGLPAVVSDWDGYQDTVPDGIAGFRIPTTIPPAGSGEDLAAAYAGGLSYDRYIGAASLATAVDPEVCGERLGELAASSELRRRLGAAGRERARRLYDWSVVVRQYADLWDDLAELRRSAPESAAPRPGEVPVPLLDDPFRSFSGFASAVLSDDTRVVALGDGAAVTAALGLGLNAFEPLALLPHEHLEALFAAVAAADGVTVATLRARLPHHSRGRLERSITWLAKLGLARLIG